MSLVTDYTTSAPDAPKIAALCVAQEAQFRFKTFSADVAWEVGTALRDTFTATFGGDPKAGVVIHIETFTGHTLFSAAVGRPPAVGPDNWYVWRRRESCSRFGWSVGFMDGDYPTPPTPAQAIRLPHSPPCTDAQALGPRKDKRRQALRRVVPA
jgi:hypothetical protein